MDTGVPELVVNGDQVILEGKSTNLKAVLMTLLGKWHVMMDFFGQLGHQLHQGNGEEVRQAALPVHPRRGVHPQRRADRDGSTGAFRIQTRAPSSRSGIRRVLAMGWVHARR